MAASTTTTSEFTMFYFDIETLLNILIVRTTRRAKTIKQNDGRELLNDYSMTDGERAEYNLFRPVIAAEVYKECFGAYGQGVEDGFQEDVNIDEITNKVIAFTFDPPLYFDDNMEGVALRYAEEALVAGMLREWYRMVGLPEIAQEWHMKYEDWKARTRNSMEQATQSAKIPHNTGFS